jgi:hypothetical protein
MIRTLQALKLGTLAAISAGGLLAGQAQAANPCFLSALAGDVDACNSASGDFEVTAVTFDGFTPAPTDILGYTLSGNDLQAQLNFLIGKTAPITNATLRYTLTLKNGRTFDTAQANITGNNGLFSTSTTSPAPGLLSAATSSGGAGSTVGFTPGLTTLTFTQTFSSTANGALVLNSLGTIYSTTPGQGDVEVPGPLPLLGAGAAFGFSRRLRNRIKVAV